MNVQQVCYSPNKQKKLVCPWQLAPLIDNYLRPLIHNPLKLFAPYAGEGMTVLDVGCGAGFASLGLAKLVGENGSVIAADLQPKMLSMVRDRAVRAGLSNRIRIHVCGSHKIGVQEKIDFALAFFMVHEVPNTQAFMEEIFTLLKRGGRFFITEPKVHVKSSDFNKLVGVAEGIGFQISERPKVRFGHTVLLMKGK